jgi:hypothetical protein
VRNNSDDDSDDEFPLIRCLLSPEYRHKLAEERSFVREGTAEMNIGKTLDDLLSHGSTAGSSQGECAELLRLKACSYSYR